MRWIIGMLCVLVVAGVQDHVATAEEPDRSKMSLTVSLTDGSRLIGATAVESLQLRSELLGKLAVPLDKIATVKFSKDHENVVITLRNGDRLQGSLNETKLEMVTLFGPVSVPLDKVTEIQVRDGTVAVLDWSILPWLRDTDWPGSQGAPAKIEGDAIELRGQAVRTKQTFMAPVTMEGNFRADRQMQHLERSMIRLVPEGTPSDIYGPAGTVAIVLQYEGTGPVGGNLYVQSGKQPAQRITRQPFTMTGDKPLHLRVDVLANSVRVTLNGETVDTVAVTLTDKPFHIQLCGWKPDSVWHVDNFKVFNH